MPSTTNTGAPNIDVCDDPRCNFDADGLTALGALHALGQSSRLLMFRTLVQHHPEGLTVNALATHVCCPQNTVSGHLAILARADLVRGFKQGRSVIYKANVGAVSGLIDYLHASCDSRSMGSPVGSECATCLSPSPKLSQRRNQEISQS